MAWVGMLGAPPRTMTSLEGGYIVCSISTREAPRARSRRLPAIDQACPMIAGETGLPPMAAMLWATVAKKKIKPGTLKQRVNCCSDRS
jgi:hypothetical protein